MVCVGSDRRRPVELHLVDVQRNDVDGPAEDSAQIGRRSVEVTVDELFDVGSGLRVDAQQKVARVVDQRFGLHRVHHPRSNGQRPPAQIVHNRCQFSETPTRFWKTVERLSKNGCNPSLEKDEIMRKRLSQDELGFLVSRISIGFLHG